MRGPYLTHNSIRNIGTYDWVVAGTAEWPSFPDYWPGKVYILFGGDPMDTIVDVELIGEHDSSGLGYSSEFGGYVNEDYWGEVLTGAEEYQNQNPGGGYLYLGGPSIDTIYDAKILGDRVDMQVASAGDVDGRDELLLVIC